MLPATSRKPLIISLQLLRLLTEGCIGDLYVKLQKLSAAEKATPELRFVIDLEQSLMSGNYEKVRIFHFAHLKFNNHLIPDPPKNLFSVRPFKFQYSFALFSVHWRHQLSPKRASAIFLSPTEGIAQKSRRFVSAEISFGSFNGPGKAAADARERPATDGLHKWIEQQRCQSGTGRWGRSDGRQWSFQSSTRWGSFLYAYWLTRFLVWLQRNQSR